MEHVRIEGETVIHELSEFTAEAGAEISGHIDMIKRVSDMQQHTGEHILSGTAHRLFGCDNVGFHLGEQIVTVDLSIPLKKEQIDRLESAANRAVRDDIKVEITFPSPEELGKIDYRSKKELEGQIRIVTIPGVDCCACCAPHLSRTGGVGLIRIVSFENHRGGTRLGVLCGERAIRDIQTKLTENKKVGAALCVKEEETSAAVQRLLKEKGELEYELKQTKLSLLKIKAASMPGQDRLIVFEDTDDVNMLRELMNCLYEKAGSLIAVFGKAEGKVAKYVLCTPGKDITPLCKAFNSRFSGRGGGRGEMAQGSVCAEEQALADYLKEISIP